MADFSNIRNFNLKVILLVHILMISLSSMGGWTGNAYLYYNLLFTLCLFWAIYRPEADEPLQLAVTINATSIILDILLLCLGFPSYGDGRDRFSAGMAILHLLGRPVSIILLGKIHQERSGTGVDLFGGQNRNYEDMDRSTPPTQSQPPQGGYDFSTAQQI